MPELQQKFKLKWNENIRIGFLPPASHGLYSSIPSIKSDAFVKGVLFWPLQLCTGGKEQFRLELKTTTL